MSHSARRLASVALSAAVASSALFAGGCDFSKNAQERADATAADASAKAVVARNNSNNPAQDAKVLAAYDNVAASTGLSPQMTITVKSQQAQYRYERAMAGVAKLQSLEIEINSTISGIDGLASEIDGAQKFIAALKSNDPAKPIADLKTQASDIAGTTGKDTWTVPLGKADKPVALSLPTAANLKAKIDKLTADIEKNKQDIVDLRKHRVDALEQADVLTRKSESETGQKQIDDVTQASNLRKDAAFADAKAQSLQVAQTRLNDDLSTAMAGQVLVEASAKQADTQVAASDTEWKSIGEQIQAQQKLQQNLIQGGWDISNSDPKAIPPTILELATKLSTDMKAADTLRSDVLRDLSGAISQFGEAQAAASKLRDSLLKKSRVADDVDAPIWKHELATLNPTNYQLSMAAALTTRAGVLSSQASIDVMLKQMFEGTVVSASALNSPITSQKLPLAPPTDVTAIPGLDKLLDSSLTGIDPPAVLSQIKSKIGDVDAETKAAYEAFGKAIDTYTLKTGVDENSQAITGWTAAANRGRQVLNQQWSQFASLVGDSDGAIKYMHAAQEAVPVTDSGDDQSPSGTASPASPFAPKRSLPAR